MKIAFAPLLLAAVCCMAQEQARVITTLALDQFKSGTSTNCFFQVGENGLGQPILIPVIVIKGAKNGPVLGVEAAIHGNELNGIGVIHRLVKFVDPKTLNGTIVAVPGVNIPGIVNEDRVFPDLEDLNRIMPGNAKGNESQVFANRYLKEIASKFNYLIDLHTASFGRINTYYARADLSDPAIEALALVQNCDIILNSREASTSGGSGTIRSALAEMKVPTITVELGDPQVFQADMIERGFEGIYNVLAHLDMIKAKPMVVLHKATICKKSYWIYTDKGGWLQVHPELNQTVKKGEKIATLVDAFGTVIKEYHAPEDGIVIGKSTNPVTPTGGRILHLGILE